MLNAMTTKTIVNFTSKLVAALTIVLMCATFADAATVQVDVDSTNSGGPQVTQALWNGWLFNQNFGGSLNVNNSFAYGAATDGTVDVNLSTTTAAGGRNYGLSNVTDPGNLTIPDVWNDQTFFNNNSSGTMTLTFDDLKAGRYQFTSYSYADPLNSGDAGIADVSVDIGAGFVDTGLNVTFVTLGSPPAGAKTAAQIEAAGTVTFQFTVANDDDQIRILYNGLAANGGDSFGINGFELESLGGPVVPEPSTFALAMLALLPLGMTRRRRDRR
jgi:hypothetical protein